MNLRGLAVVLAVVLGGCSDDESGGGSRRDAPDGGGSGAGGAATDGGPTALTSTLSIDLDPVPAGLPGGRTCMRVPNPFGGEVGIRSLQVAGPPELVRLRVSATRGTGPCEPDATESLLYLGSALDDVLDLPDGFGLSIGAGQTIQVDAQYAAPPGGQAPGPISVVLERVPDGVSFEVVQPQRMGLVWLGSLPPGSGMSRGFACNGLGMTVLATVGIMGSRGVAIESRDFFSASAYAPATARTRTLDPPVVVPPGATPNFDCSWGPVTELTPFGDSFFDSEDCSLVLYVPSSSSSPPSTHTDCYGAETWYASRPPRVGPAHCLDGHSNDGETGLDCGGDECQACFFGEQCAVDADCPAWCADGFCNPQATSCINGVRDRTEPDVDCGGPAMAIDCPRCADGRACFDHDNCESRTCLAGICAQPRCDDGVTDGFEVDVDCGGACPPCGRGATCVVDSDCAEGLCGLGRCLPPYGLDGATCTGDAECVGGTCILGRCSAAPCTGAFQAPPAGTGTFDLTVRVVSGPAPVTPLTAAGVLAESAGGDRVEGVTSADGTATLTLDRALGPWMLTAAKAGLAATSIFGVDETFAGDIRLEPLTVPEPALIGISGEVSGATFNVQVDAFGFGTAYTSGSPAPYDTQYADAAGLPLQLFALDLDAAGWPTNFAASSPLTRDGSPKVVNLAFPSPATTPNDVTIDIIVPQTGLVNWGEIGVTDGGKVVDWTPLDEGAYAYVGVGRASRGAEGHLTWDLRSYSSSGASPDRAYAIFDGTRTRLITYASDLMNDATLTVGEVSCLEGRGTTLGTYGASVVASSDYTAFLVHIGETESQAPRWRVITTVRGGRAAIPWLPHLPAGITLTDIGLTDSTTTSLPLLVALDGPAWSTRIANAGTPEYRYSVATAYGYPATCDTGNCDPAPANCADGIRNALETDVDCGGTDCAPCGLGATCTVDADCGVGTCVASGGAPSCS